jgi:hypothetical protein
MDCETIRKKLPEHVEGLLPKNEVARVTEHLASCAECREEYADLLKTVAHLKNLEEIEPPGWLTAKVMAKVKEEAEKEKRGWRAIFRPYPLKLPLGAAATVLIAVAALYIFREIQPATTISPARHPEVRMQRAGEGNSSEQIVPGTSTKPQETKKPEGPVASRPEAPGRAGALKSADEEPSKAAAAKESERAGNAPSPPMPAAESETRRARSEERGAPPEVYDTAPAAGGKTPAPAAVGGAAALAPQRQKAERKEARLAKKAAGRSATIVAITASDMQIKDLLEKEMQRRLDKIAACYEKGRGKVDVTFVITAEGDTKQERVIKDDTGDEAGAKCLVEEMKKWRFSFVMSSVKVSATFDIQP